MHALLFSRLFLTPSTVLTALFRHGLEVEAGLEVRLGLERPVVLGTLRRNPLRDLHA